MLYSKPFRRTKKQQKRTRFVVTGPIFSLYLAFLVSSWAFFSAFAIFLYLRPSLLK